MHFSYIKTFLVAACFLHVQSIQGMPQPGRLDPTLELRLKVATTSIDEGYEQRVKPAMEGVAEKGSRNIRQLLPFMSAPAPDPEIIRSLRTATPEQQTEVLTTWSSRIYNHGFWQSGIVAGIKRFLGLAAMSKKSYEELQASAKRMEGKIRANLWKSRLELQQWVRGVELLALEAEYTAKGLEAIVQ